MYDSLRKILRLSVFASCLMSAGLQNAYAQSAAVYMDQVWAADCDNPDAFALLWIKSAEGNLHKVTHQTAAKVYAAKSYQLSDTGLTVRYHDFSETYVYGLRDGLHTVRVKNRERSGKTLISEYKLSSGGFSTPLYRCDSDDPKALVTVAYSKKKPSKNLISDTARAWDVLLTAKEIRAIQSPLISKTLYEKSDQYSSTDWIYSGSVRFGSSGLNEQHFDSSAETEFVNAGLEISVKIDAFREVKFARQQIAYEKSRINGKGSFATRPVTFADCGDESLGAMWKSFAPDYFCRVGPYLIEISSGAFGNTERRRKITEAVMVRQVEKILRLTK